MTSVVCPAYLPKVIAAGFVLYGHDGIQNLMMHLVNLFTGLGKQTQAGYFSDRTSISFGLLLSKDLSEVLPPLKSGT